MTESPVTPDPQLRPVRGGAQLCAPVRVPALRQAALARPRVLQAGRGGQLRQEDQHPQHPGGVQVGGAWSPSHHDYCAHCVRCLQVRDSDGRAQQRVLHASPQQRGLPSHQWTLSIRKEECYRKSQEQEKNIHIDILFNRTAGFQLPHFVTTGHILTDLHHADF